MKQQELITLLKHVESVTTSDWNIVRAVVAGIEAGDVHVTHSERLDWKKDFMEGYPLNLSKIEEWSTLEVGTDLRFRHSDGSLICYAKIWNTDRDMYGSYRSDLKWTAKLVLKDEFIKHISSNIIRKFNLSANYEYDKYLDEVKRLWTENYKQSILNPS